MPISPKTVSDLKKITDQLDFLLTVLDVEVGDIPADRRDCFICQEPFEKTVWKKKGDSINSPVKLDCGHIFGISCLAKLVFTSDFNNTCPLCRARIIPDSYEKTTSYRSWQVAAPLLQLFTILDRDVASAAKEQALGFLQRGFEREKLVPLPGKHTERTMVLYEEFLNQFCDFPPPVEDGRRLEAAEEGSRNLRRDLRRHLAIRRELDGRYERSKARMTEIHNLTEQKLKRSQQALNGAREALKRSTGLFFLYGMVATLTLLGLCGRLSGSLGTLVTLYERPSRILLRLWLIACTIASRTTLAILSLVTLGIPFE
ncbi:hypothetical protein HO173_000059 [Letharia columbiana]|uniref:RING-type domain-containing protein n=1 Tax=Letharia columbiana TaxID=112416 RepID=A0A8H6LAB7_9LECA|nr:uncharacterized protein HO173_000059 [Letharia columbiana]KAF6241349.1 hypothetical protein HO173_000059 [Letharia columbiana]